MGGSRRGARRADPDDVRESHHGRRSSSSCFAMNMPKDSAVAGSRCSAGARLRADRARDERARMVRPHPPAWAPEVVSPSSSSAGSCPRSAGAARVLRDHRGRRRLGRRCDRGDGRRDGDGYVLNGTKNARDVVQRRRLPLLPGEDRRRTARRRTRDVLRRQGTPGVRLVREPAYAHTYADSTRSWRSRACGCRRRTWSGRRATAWTSRTPGSGTSGS